eukprot:scaffold5.g966.t1
MRLDFFVRTQHGGVVTLAADTGETVGDVKRRLEAREGVPVGHQVLLLAGKQLEDDTTLAACGLGRDDTMHQTSRLRGGKRVTVRILTNHLPCGQEVAIDIEPGASKDEIKAKLEAATGVPAQHQKVMLSGIDQIVMGDKRTNIGFSACGSANGVQMAVGK